MTDFLRSQGVLALGSRLRAISDRLFAQGDAVYAARGLSLRARWFPIVSLLNQQGPQTVTAIAEQIGFSHPAVIAITSKMKAAGLLVDRRDPADERRRLISLSDEGRTMVREVESTWNEFRHVAATAVARCGVDFVAALDRFDTELETHPWPQAMAQLSAQAKPMIEIIDYEPRYQPDFEALNVEWLDKYFTVEPIDQKVLSNPQQHILEPGGAIVFARLDGDIVGTCALKHQGDGVFELTKMGVTADHQGFGIGVQLMRGVIDRFKQLNGRQLYLETNAILEPAITLYRRFGFVDQGQRKSGSIYQRADVYMVWDPAQAPSGM